MAAAAEADAAPMMPVVRQGKEDVSIPSFIIVGARVSAAFASFNITTTSTTPYLHDVFMLVYWLFTADYSAHHGGVATSHLVCALTVSDYEDLMLVWN